MLFLKRFFLFYLVLTLFLPVKIFAEAATEISRGNLEGKRAAMEDVNKVCWLGAGATILGFGVAMVWSSSDPDPAEFTGKSPEYVRAYTESYNSRVKKEQIIYSSIGCAGTLLVVGMIVLISNAASDVESDCVRIDNCFDGCFESTEETEGCLNSGGGCSDGSGSSCADGS